MNQGASPWERPFGPRYSQKRSYYYTVCSFKTQPKTLQSGEEILGSGLGKETKGACPAGAFWTGAGPALVRRRPPAGGLGRWSCRDQRRLAPARWFPPPTPAGEPGFLRRKPEERAPGALPPGPPVLWPLVSTRWFWGWLSLSRSRGDFLRYAKTDLGRIFQKKYAEKEFCKRKSPNQGTYMGLVIAYRPERCGTTAKTSEWERAGPKPGGAGGYPPATLCVRAFSRESLDPPPGTGREPTSQGLTCAGPSPDHLPKTDSVEPPPPKGPGGGLPVPPETASPGRKLLSSLDRFPAGCPGVIAPTHRGRRSEPPADPASRWRRTDTRRRSCSSHTRAGPGCGRPDSSAVRSGT